MFYTNKFVCPLLDNCRVVPRNKSPAAENSRCVHQITDGGTSCKNDAPCMQPSPIPVCCLAGQISIKQALNHRSVSIGPSNGQTSASPPAVPSLSSRLSSQAPRKTDSALFPLRIRLRRSSGSHSHRCSGPRRCRRVSSSYRAPT